LIGRRPLGGGGVIARVGEDVDLYPWVPLRFADATPYAIDGTATAAAGSGDAIAWTINNPGAFPSDYPSRADGLVWPAGYGLPAGASLTALGSGGWLPVFRLVTALVTLPAAQANVWAAVGLGDQDGEADAGSCRILLGGVRHTASGRLSLATRRNADLVSSANESSADTYDVLINADNRRLNRVTTSGLSPAGNSSDVSQTEASTYDLASMRIAMYAGADSTTGTGPHALTVTAYVRWLPMLP